MNLCRLLPPAKVFLLWFDFSTFSDLPRPAFPWFSLATSPSFGLSAFPWPLLAWPLFLHLACPLFFGHFSFIFALSAFPWPFFLHFAFCLVHFLMIILTFFLLRQNFCSAATEAELNWIFLYKLYILILTKCPHNNQNADFAPAFCLSKDGRNIFFSPPPNIITHCKFSLRLRLLNIQSKNVSSKYSNQHVSSISKMYLASIQTNMYQASVQTNMYQASVQTKIYLASIQSKIYPASIQINVSSK